MLKNLQPRLYQETIFGTAAKKNTLVVLPTGMGKTAIALLLAAQRLHQYPQSKILILAPTKPLCEQHVRTFQQHLELEPEKIVLLTGEIAPEKRAKLWQQAQVIASTPQGLENDVINRTLDFSSVSLAVFDEAHHATGDYAYGFIAKQYSQLAQFPRILALTASPGSDMEKIKEVCKALFIEAVEVRTEKDHDVRPYIQQVDYKWLQVPLPEQFQKIQKLLSDHYKAKLEEAKKFGYVHARYYNKTELLKLQAELHAKLREGKDFLILKTISILAEALKVQHALELLETQGLIQLQKYLQKLSDESHITKVQAVKNLVASEAFKAAFYLTEQLVQQHVLHPKLEKLKELVQQEVENNKGCKAIIFTQYRDSAVEIVKALTALQLSSKIFVGQVKKGETGVSQKEQKQILGDFRNGQFNFLVSTSVGEEGIDIPSVDLILFYEPIPSAIRHIQRRGRTGRLEKGRVIILVTEGTRDVAFRWTAHHKEKRMHRILEQMKREFSFLQLGEPMKQISTEGQRQETSTLTRFVGTSSPRPVVLADYREKGNKIVKELIDLGISVKLERLEHADYVLSGRVAVELKTVEDFVGSIIDGRLLEQAKQLRNAFERPVLIVEGIEDIYGVRKVHPNAIRGALAALVAGYGIPVVQTRDNKETAALLAAFAKREQEKDSSYQLHSQKPMNTESAQEYIVSAFPSVGPQLAKDLLKQFKTIKNIVNASEEELRQVEGVGEKISKRIKEAVEGEWKER